MMARRAQSSAAAPGATFSVATTVVGGTKYVAAGASGGVWIGNGTTMTLGTIPETSESVLMRVANDVRSLDYNSAQIEGKYYYAATAADVGPAFQQLQSQIVRLSK